jgi:predicted dehydrogenase
VRVSRCRWRPRRHLDAATAVEPDARRACQADQQPEDGVAARRARSPLAKPSGSCCRRDRQQLRARRAGFGVPDALIAAVATPVKLDVLRLAATQGKLVLVEKPVARGAAALAILAPSAGLRAALPMMPTGGPWIQTPRLDWLPAEGQGGLRWG